MVNKRKLGSSDLLVSPIAFGGNVFGWTIDESESFKILDAFVDSGFNFIDTADSYSKWAPGNHGGESEIIISKWLRKSGKRKDVIIATKFGVDLGDGKRGLSSAYMKKAVEASLKRLGTDYIDLYQSHIDEPETPVEETMTSFSELIKEGKVRYIGASNFSAQRLMSSNDFARSNNMPPYVCLQPLYNLYDREPFETEYSKLIKEESLGVIPYYSLASGFLTGKYRSEQDLIKSARGESVRKYLTLRGYKILSAMDDIAREQNAALSQIALAWLLSRQLVTAPIASATNLGQLAEILKATSISLTPDQLEKLDNASNYSNPGH